MKTLYALRSEFTLSATNVLYAIMLCAFAVSFAGCRSTEQFVQPDPKQPPVRFEGVRLPGNTAVVKAVIDAKTGVADVLLNPRCGTDIKQSLKLAWFNLLTWFRDIWWIIVFVCAFAELLKYFSRAAFWLAAKAMPWLAVLGTAVDWLLKVCPKFVLTIMAGGLCGLYLLVFKHADKWYALIIPAIAVFIANIAWEYVENKFGLVTGTASVAKNIVTGYVRKRVAPKTPSV